MNSTWWQRARTAALVGLGATATMDLGAELIRRATGAAPLDYALVARWIGHLPRGQFTHHSIAEADPVPAEKALGLVVHHATGVGFAVLLLASHPSWAQRPTLGPALATGLGSTAAPFFLMQPAFGLGFAASNTANPALARFRSLRAHAIYGLGLYLTGQALTRLGNPRLVG